MKNTIDRLEKALLQAGRLAKGSGAGFADQVRAVVADFRDFEQRLGCLEKDDAATQGARLDVADADSDRARINRLEAELAVLKARHEPAAHVEGVAKTLGLGRAIDVAETEKSPPAARAVDPWRH